MAWQPIETAPRDGTLVTLTWFENGKPQEVYPAMQWDKSEGNPAVQDGNGIWLIRALDNKVLMTWSEENGHGPTHWRPFEDTASWAN